MEFIPSLKRDRSPLAVEAYDRGAEWHEERLIAVSSWMMVLGTIRVLCTFADQVAAFSNAVPFEPFSLRMLNRFVEANQPFLALSVVWPLLIGLILRRTRWPEFLPAAAATFLILSSGGLMELAAEGLYARGNGITFGSFQLTRRVLLNPTLSDATMVLLGTSQLLMEFVTALRCLRLARYFHGARAHPTESGRQEGSRRARLGRIAVYASLGFLVLMIRLPVWSTYLEIVNDSPIVREFVLKNDFKRTSGTMRGRKLTQEEEQMRDLRMSLGAAAIALRSNRFLEAKETYLRIIARAESSAEIPLPRESIAAVAEARNNLAWLLATCPKTELRDPREAVEHARRAVAIAPKVANYWNTLGAAHYRNGEWDEAKDALHRAIELTGEGDGFDWFFLALVHLKQGQRAQAFEWYEKAVGWYQRFLPLDRELHLFHTEAALELGLPKPAPRPELSKSRRRLL